MARQRSPERFYRYFLGAAILLEAGAIVAFHANNAELSKGLGSIGGVVALLGFLNYMSTRNGGLADSMF